MFIGTTVYELTTFEILIGWMVVFIIGFVTAIVLISAFIWWLSRGINHKPTTETNIPEQEVTQVKRRRRRSQ